MQKLDSANVDDHNSDEESFHDCIQKVVSDKDLRSARVLYEGLECANLAALTLIA